MKVSLFANSAPTQPRDSPDLLPGRTCPKGLPKGTILHLHETNTTTEFISYLVSVPYIHIILVRYPYGTWCYKLSGIAYNLDTPESDGKRAYHRQALSIQYAQDAARLYLIFLQPPNPAPSSRPAWHLPRRA